MTDAPKGDFYPKLSEEATAEAQELMDAFKDRMKKICCETLADLYTNVSLHIESDGWSNYRNQIVMAYRGYGDAKNERRYDFKEFRKKMFEEFREEIIKDLDQDVLQELTELQERFRKLEEIHYDRRILPSFHMPAFSKLL